MPQNREDYLSNPSIAIVGLGMVGGAIDYATEGWGSKVLIDPAKGYKGTYEQAQETAAVFICVPSPQGDDGSCDTSILESVLDKLVDYKGVIISKCTAPPSVYTRLSKKFSNLVHAPEFLTAAKANQDYLNGTFAFIGGSVLAYQKEAERIIRMTQPSLQKVFLCGIEEAALAKYAINSFLATKVVFMNELYLLAKSAGIDYNVVRGMMSADKRIGGSHMIVPGADGFGFSGMCFPKDTSALLKYGDSVDMNLTLLRQATETNKMLRKVANMTKSFEKNA